MDKHNNPRITVTIEDITNMGLGVTHIKTEDGRSRTVFVQGGVDGDTAVIQIIKSTKSYDIARIEELITPSEYRITPDCPVFKRCGGCVYRNISYKHELELKASYVQNCFNKEGIKLQLSEVLSDGSPDRYRNKVQYPVQNGKTGYYAQHSHEIIQCDGCMLQRPELDVPVKVITSFINVHDMKEVRHIYLRCGTGGVMVCLVIRGKQLSNRHGLVNTIVSECPDVCSILVNYNESDTNVILGKRFETIWEKNALDKSILTDTLCGLKFEIAPDAFWQVNHNAAEILYKKVCEFADPAPGDRIIDLYCGTGSIGLTVIANKPDVNLLGVEIVPSAVEDARNNAEINHLRNARFICADLSADSDGILGKADTVILDPPRKGCDYSLLDNIAKMKIPKIVYVSCSPDTLARDCAIMIKNGYSIERSAAVNMFPRTGHVETVVLLSQLRQKSDDYTEVEDEVAELGN